MHVNEVLNVDKVLDFQDLVRARKEIYLWAHYVGEQWLKQLKQNILQDY